MGFVHCLMTKLNEELWQTLLFCYIPHGEFSTLLTFLISYCFRPQFNKLYKSKTLCHHSFISQKDIFTWNFSSQPRQIFNKNYFYILIALICSALPTFFVNHEFIMCNALFKFPCNLSLLCISIKFVSILFGKEFGSVCPIRS